MTPHGGGGTASKPSSTIAAKNCSESDEAHVILGADIFTAAQPVGGRRLAVVNEGTPQRTAASAHELSVSAFTARCVASAGATLYSVAVAAFCVALGSRTGGQAERVEAFFEEVRKTRDARAVVSGRLRRRERLPGFGHPLSAKGDPRAKLLLEMTADAYPRSPPTIAMQSMVRAVETFASEL